MTSVAHLQDGVIGALLAVPDFRSNVGEAVWTYLALLKAANHRGVVCKRSDQIAATLNTDEPALLTDLAKLSDLGLIRSLNPAPYLVIQLATWPGKEEAPAAHAPAIRSETPAIHGEVPVSGVAAAAASASRQEVGGHGEGGTLVDRVLAVLGQEADAGEMRDLVGAYPAEIVRRALTRVEATPASQIRRSRTALFRYLLTKLN